MKTALPALVASFLALTATLAAEPWTLADAVRTARENSPDARLAEARLSGAEALLEQAQAAWLPQIMLSGRYTQTNSPMVAFGSILNQRAFNFGLDFNHPGRIDNLNATATVAYNLYAGGRPTAGRVAARAGARAAEHDLRTARLQLGTGVVRAYLGIRKAREAVTALTAGVRAYEAAAANARLRFAAGQMLKADLLSLEVQLAQTRESLVAARHGATLADHAFHLVLGLEAPAQPVALVDDDPSLHRLSAPDPSEPSERPELLGLQERLRAAEAMVTAARGGQRPTVNAFASYQYDQGWKLNRQADGWLAGLSVDLNVFDGGQTSGRIRQAQAEVSQLKELLRQASFNLGFEVEQSRLALAHARERLAVTAGAVAQAAESADLSRARFEQGALLTADLIGVESRLVEARMRRAVAVADELIALADLRRSLGHEPLTP